jgi:hypothetical protein
MKNSKVLIFLSLEKNFQFFNPFVKYDLIFDKWKVIILLIIKLLMNQLKNIQFDGLNKLSIKISLVHMFQIYIYSWGNIVELKFSLISMIYMFHNDFSLWNENITKVIIILLSANSRSLHVKELISIILLYSYSKRLLFVKTQSICDIEFFYVSIKFTLYSIFLSHIFVFKNASLLVRRK